MHEVGIMEQAVEMALEAAQREGATQVVRMKLRIGSLAGVVPDALAFAFDMVTRETAAEGAEFEWEEVPVRCRCRTGCADFEPDGPIFACPSCGLLSTEVLQGRELNLVEIEVAA
ncbi:MAG TPA: hydrogenase maturation nickel metallochaperone HypA [Fimbriimonas sp.]